MNAVSYKEIVGQQAVDLEQRMLEAGVSLYMHADHGLWNVSLVSRRADVGLRTYLAQAQSLSQALWAAANAAGLTEGLVPPTGAPVVTP